MRSSESIYSTDIVILLVEDYDGDAFLIQEKLRISKVTGYSMERVSSLAETITWLENNTADVILLDMNIGDSNGLATVNAVAETAEDAAIVVLTGDHGQDLGMGALEAGAQDFLGKDEINARNLRRIVAFAMSRRRFQLNQLQQAIQQYQQMAAEAEDVHVPNAPSESADKMTPALHTELVHEYRGLLHAYLDSLVINKAKPNLDLNDFVARLGAAGAGPKDVLGLHVTALEAAMTDARPERARFLNTDGRLLALEVMGRLVAFYRASSKASLGAEN